MKKVKWYQEKVQSGELLSKKELLELAEEPLSELCQAADEIRRSFCGNAFDLCAVISAKGGVCSEDCAFCAQSGHNPSCHNVPQFPLLSELHNNLESSEKHFRTLCTTHTYEEKKRTIQSAKEAGLSVCSGALFGIGETMEDRIELALTERELGVTSIPVNMIDPVPGTAFEKAQPPGNSEMRRIVALFRFALPTAWIRLAAGREYLPDKGKSCFLSGANAAISGDFLTTLGISIDSDLEMLREIGYEV